MRVVTDFRYLNIRIAKNNSAYPLLKDTLSMLSSSRCEVLLCKAVGGLGSLDLSRVFMLHIYLQLFTALHNCSSLGSLVFTTIAVLIRCNYNYVQLYTL